jgi:hypothetical protein
MVIYAQQFMTAEMLEHQRREAEIDQWMKELVEWQGVIAINLGTWRRNGPSEALRQRIEEAGREYGIRLRNIMDASSIVADY